MGRSPRGAHDHLSKRSRVQREDVDPVVQFATTELGTVLVEGTNWPHNRAGEDLAQVPVAR